MDFFAEIGKADCCGCRACEQICNHNALRMECDEEGFLYPVLDDQKCVDCKLCEGVCPIKNNITRQDLSPLVYAAKNNNADILMKSSSGGIFSVIAAKVLSLEGVVYGAAFDTEMNLRHLRVSSPNDLYRLRGSKYVQSDVGNTYVQVKEDLKKGLYVYYTGTPCQIAGLRLFLRKEYSHLLTSDLICHGTPSQKLFSKVAAQMEIRKDAKLTDHLFRDKSLIGWSCSSTSFFLRKEKTMRIRYAPLMKAYFNAFIKGDIMRMVCYSCPFSNEKRVGDITIADFWGVEKFHPNFPHPRKGVSLVMVNTKQGEAFWNLCADSIFSIQSELRYALLSNANLQEPTPFTSQRNDSYKLAFKNFQLFLDRYSSPHPLKEYLMTVLRMIRYRIMR